MSEPLHTRRAQYQARAIAGLWRMLSRWPVTRLWRIAAFMGPQIYRFSKRERRVTELNLARVFPDQTAQQRKAFAIQSLQHSTATMLELGHAWMAPPEKVEASILAVHGRDKLDSARAEGRGVIVLAPHFGNWEVLNFWLSSHFPFTAMYEPPKIADLEAITRHGRERMGAQLVPTNPRGVAALLKALKRSEAIGILPDRGTRTGAVAYSRRSTGTRPTRPPCCPSWSLGPGLAWSRGWHDVFPARGSRFTFWMPTNGSTARTTRCQPPASTPAWKPRLPWTHPSTNGNTSATARSWRSSKGSPTPTISAFIEHESGMTESSPHPPNPPQDTRPPQIVYALYLAGLVTANITLLIGVIVAYVYRREAAPDCRPTTAT